MDIIKTLEYSLDITKKLRDLSKKIENADFTMFLADLQIALADTKLETANLKQQLAEQIEKNIELEKQLKAKTDEKPEFRNGGYHFPGDASVYCSACYDSKGKKIRLNELPPSFKAIGRFTCPIYRVASR
jgi:hypothetical protein